MYASCSLALPPPPPLPLPPRATGVICLTGAGQSRAVRTEASKDQQQHHQRQEGEQEEKGGDAITVASAGWRFFTRERDVRAPAQDGGGTVHHLHAHETTTRVLRAAPAGC
ncbi:unnamed protein product [Closterium sp. NIES-54]